MPPLPCALALHGGCGTLSRQSSGPASLLPFERALEEALHLGWAQLQDGSSALDAVCSVVAQLEDCPLFNAGRGSVLNAGGQVEMDAALMHGASLRAGSAAAVTGVRHPILLAREILLGSDFVFLAGPGAVEFARERGLEMAPPEWFILPSRRAQLEAAQAANLTLLDHDKYGTVGAVALDQAGHLAAATSTGGLTNKRFGRIGDTPVIGAGTWADNRSCAVSCTGYGEEFIRSAAAHSVASRMLFGRESLSAAAARVIHHDLPAISGQGGLIAVDATGEIALPFNTEGMYRAWRNHLGDSGIAVF